MGKNAQQRRNRRNSKKQNDYFRPFGDGHRCDTVCDGEEHFCRTCGEQLMVVTELSGLSVTSRWTHTAQIAGHHAPYEPGHPVDAIGSTARAKVTTPSKGDSFVTMVVGQPWTGDPRLIQNPGAKWMPESGMFIISVQGDELGEEERAALGRPYEVSVLVAKNLVGLGLNIPGFGEFDTYTGMPAGGPPPHFLGPHTPRSRQAINVVVVVNGNVQKCSLFTLSPETSQTLWKAGREVWATLTDDQFLEQYGWVTSTYPTAPEAIANLAVSTCKRGA